MLKGIPSWRALLMTEKVLTCEGLLEHLFLRAGSTTTNVVHATVVSAHRYTTQAGRQVTGFTVAVPKHKIKESCDAPQKIYGIVENERVRQTITFFFATSRGPVRINNARAQKTLLLYSKCLIPTNNINAPSLGTDTVVNPCTPRAHVGRFLSSKAVCN